MYQAEVTTANDDACTTASTMAWHFYQSCDFSKTQKYYCNGNRSISTITSKFIPPKKGDSTMLKFYDVNFGQLNYIYLQTVADWYYTTNDAWCLKEVRFLMDDKTNKWKTCDFGFMGFIPIDFDCTGFGGGFFATTIDILTENGICYDDDPPKSGTFYFYVFAFCLYTFNVWNWILC